MKNGFGPILPGAEHILHGADYNPEQFLYHPEVLSEDIRLMKLAGCNIMSVGIFAWAALEPREYEYHFEWLDEVLDRLAENGIGVLLATPSAARPVWMTQKYPDVARTDERGRRQRHGGRQNHCSSSVTYRKKVTEINTLLAKRYGHHPAVRGWHVSNEYVGEGCYCEKCQSAFREWLKQKYHGDIHELNEAWWTYFWSHTYQSFDEIEAPSPLGEMQLHGLNLDWKRFISHMQLDFYLMECEPLRRLTPNLPVTTNFHDFVHLDGGVNYWEWAPHVDFISWDNYPYWHTDTHSNWEEAVERAFIHDINRSLKNGKPFALLESSPSATNWQPVAKLRRPGMLNLGSVQAIAHGADTVQYFQWRKSLGGSEKFHGAVVDHYGGQRTRVFQEVQQMGEELSKLDSIIGVTESSKVAIIYDWENAWAMNDAEGPRQKGLDYFETCIAHYQPFWTLGIQVDVINMEHKLEGYDLVIAPMLYMLPENVARRMARYVENGGYLVTTYWSGIVDENDRCRTCGRPNGLRQVLGIWSEEIDALYDSDVVDVEGYKARTFCDLIHLDGAESLLSYSSEFYAGRPALTRNHYGKGYAFYIAFRSYDSFLQDFYTRLAQELKLPRAINAGLPIGVTAQKRGDILFVQNYDGESKQIQLDQPYYDRLTGQLYQGWLPLKPYSYQILES